MLIFYTTYNVLQNIHPSKFLLINKNLIGYTFKFSPRQLKAVKKTKFGVFVILNKLILYKIINQLFIAKT